MSNYIDASSENSFSSEINLTKGAVSNSTHYPLSFFSQFDTVQAEILRREGTMSSIRETNTPEHAHMHVPPLDQRDTHIHACTHTLYCRPIS